MPPDWTFHREALFTDPRPPLDVKYDIEKRVGRILARDSSQAHVLLYRNVSPSVVSTGTTAIELRLDAAHDTTNLFAFSLDHSAPPDPRNETEYSANLQRAFDRWTTGLVMPSTREAASVERYLQVMQQTIAREWDLANHPVSDEDLAAIRVIQDAILAAMRQGKSFFTAHKEGGTNIKFVGDRFVLQDYGESDDREEFKSEEIFLARLRQFYDWPSSRDRYPHKAPELDVWNFIQRELR
jgi:hypothetical protein